MLRRLFFLAALTATASAACGGSLLQKPPSLLTEVRGYNDGVRWAQPEKSALRVPPEQRSDFVAAREEVVDDLRVGDYEIKSIRYRKARTEARIDVRYTWHLDSRGVVHETVSRQAWERRGKFWMLVEEERLRGEPMPGLAEPEPESEVAGGQSDVEGEQGRDSPEDDESGEDGQVVFDSGPVSR